MIGLHKKICNLNSANIYRNRYNYNLYSLNGVRGSYIALDQAVSDYKDWKGKGFADYQAVANSNFRQLASEIQNPYEQMAFGKAERSFYETAVNVGGYKPGSKENNALLPYYIHGSFSSPLPLETAANARLPNSGVKVNGKLPTTKGNRVSYNITDPRLVYEKDQFGNEILYRAMSPEQYEQMRITGKVPASGETFISPSQAYSRDYNGVLVKITVKPGTMKSLKADAGAGNDGTKKIYPNMGNLKDDWTQNNQAQIKLEGTKKKYINNGQGVVNTGLGKSGALDKFNSSIVKFEKIGK